MFKNLIKKAMPDRKNKKNKKRKSYKPHKKSLMEKAYLTSYN